MTDSVEMSVDFGDGLQAALGRLNRLRYRAKPTPEWSTAESIFDDLFGVEVRLAVYGTLAPGAPNHQVLDGIVGQWTEGAVHGELLTVGWGSVDGYNALRWDEEARPLPIHLLVSQDLKRNWERLDAFEGPGYQRILVPVYRRERVVAVANIYEGRR